MMNLAEYRRTATRLADYLPWAALVGSGVVLNKDGSFQRTAKFRGPDLDSAVAAELVAVAGRINNAVRRLGSGWSIFVEAQRHEAATYPRSTFPDAASALIDAERKADFEEAGSHFESSYFLTIVYLPPAEDSARAETWLYEGREQTGVNPWEILKSFVDRTDRVLALLEGFDQPFLANTTYAFGALGTGYGSAREVWDAMAQTPNLAVVDSAIVPRRDQFGFTALTVVASLLGAPIVHMILTRKG